MTVIWLVFYLTFPAFLIFLTRRFSVLAKIGPVVLAYVFGLVVGNIGLLPSGSDAWKQLLGHASYLPSDQLSGYVSQGILTAADLEANRLAMLQDLLMSTTIVLAIPMLLFGLDLKRWLRLARETLFSMLLGVVSLVVVVVGSFFLLKAFVPDAWKIAGMLIGVYTGGTPNLAAISTALEVAPNLFILTHTYDLLVGSLFLLFLLTGAQKLFNCFLPAFRSGHPTAGDSSGADPESDLFGGMFTRTALLQQLAALALSAAIMSIGAGLSFLAPRSAQMVIVILSITSLGLLAGLHKRVSELKMSFHLGMYLILVFSLLVSSMGDLRSMFSIDFLYLFLFVVLGVFGSMIVHVFLSWLFRVDSDTTIITITALTYSPPFVPVVAASLRNKDLIISGLAVGILGYAFGTYLGVAIAYMLQSWM